MPHTGVATWHPNPRSIHARENPHKHINAHMLPNAHSAHPQYSSGKETQHAELKSVYSSANAGRVTHTRIDPVFNNGKSDGGGRVDQRLIKLSGTRALRQERQNETTLSNEEVMWKKFTQMRAYIIGEARRQHPGYVHPPAYTLQICDLGEVMDEVFSASLFSSHFTLQHMCHETIHKLVKRWTTVGTPHQLKSQIVTSLVAPVYTSIRNDTLSVPLR